MQITTFLMALEWSVKETTKTIDIGYFRDLNDIFFDSRYLVSHRFRRHSE